MIDSVDARSESLRRAARLRLQRDAVEHDEVHLLQVDTFQVLSEWSHFAILALSNLRDFQSDPEWIARTLRIEPAVAKAAIERLVRLSLLVEKKGKLRAVSRQIVAAEKAKEAVHRFHRELLEKAAEALLSQSSEERESSTMFMTVDAARLAEVKEKMKQFRRRLAASMDKDKTDRLYCLSTHFFRVSSQD